MTGAVWNMGCRKCLHTWAETFPEPTLLGMFARRIKRTRCPKCDVTSKYLVMMNGPDMTPAPWDSSEATPALAESNLHQAAGGRARAAKLTPERRQEIGRQAAQARWRKQNDG